MNWFKFIIFALILVFAVFLGFTVIGFLYSAFWYIFWIGVVALGGYAGYKLITKKRNLEIEGIDSVSQIELDNAKIVRELEEFKKKVNR